MRRDREKNIVINKNTTSRLIAYRYIMTQCKSMGIPIVKPADIKSFLDILKSVSKEKKKAANLLFEEIEHDIMGKERFVLE